MLHDSMLLTSVAPCGRCGRATAGHDTLTRRLSQFNHYIDQADAVSRRTCKIMRTQSFTDTVMPALDDGAALARSKE